MSQVVKQSALSAEASSSDASDLIVRDHEARKELIAEIEVRPNEQLRTILGTYTTASPPKGFAIHTTPDPEPDAVVTQISNLGTDEEYRLVLHIANYGDKVISTEVWQII